jgi:tetratricopeptide (TPR) repeat protein
MMRKRNREFASSMILTMLCFSPTPSHLFTARAQAQINGEIPEPEGLSAYKRFWDAFQVYERKRRQAAVNDYQKARELAEQNYSNSNKESLKERKANIESAIARYKEALDKASETSSRPYVLLNLAQMYAELSFLRLETGESDDGSGVKSALSALDDLERNHANFEKLSDGLYLKATLLESNGDKKNAHPIWLKLAKSGFNRFALHANLVIGDAEFDNASPETAVKSYERARDILDKIDDGDRGIDNIRIGYRLAWATFKAGRYADTLDSIRNALSKNGLAKARPQRDHLIADLGDLTAYALFAKNNDDLTKATLSDRTFLRISPRSSITLMSQYMDANLPRNASEIGSIAVIEFPHSQEFPEILRLKATADDKAGRPAAKLEALEKLSLLLPSNSLWRLRNSDNSQLIKNMENLARNAAEFVAANYYQDGMASNNPKKFSMASSHYRILLDDQPNSDKAPSLRLNIANCEYFSGNLREAERRYTELVSALKTPEDVLINAYYQRALTFEKLWRSEFEAIMQRGSSQNNNPRLVSKLNQLELAVEDHANRYPKQSRSIDLLLVAAGANRDQNRFEEASRFWQRALLSNPSPGQRAIAIRGLVFAKIRSGSTPDVIETVSNFLKLEPRSEPLGTLRKELLGVLHSAATDESTRLAKKGSSENAGTLLLQVVSDFDDIPHRDQMWRDGAYFLAISGNWGRAQASAENYLKVKHKRFDADMRYLLARAHEYQLRFADAVKAYINLAEKHPSHARALASLERAEKLALADNNYVLAGRASELRANIDRRRGTEMSSLETAINFYSLGGQMKKAMAAAERRRASSKTIADKLEAEFLVAQIRYQSGDKQVALDDLDTLAKQIERSKSELGQAYQRLAADTNMLLGEHALKDFKDIQIDGSTPKASAKVEKKSSLFSELASRFEKVSSLEHPELSPKARFLVAKSASDFADEINSIPTRTGEPTSLRSQTRFNQNVSRLRDLAQKYHGNNLLAKQRNPNTYNRNEWISRSALALTGNLGSDAKNGNLTSNVDQLSTASSTESPVQWSH